MAAGQLVTIRLSPSGPPVETIANDGSNVEMQVGRGMILRMEEAVSSAITQTVQTTQAVVVNTSSVPFTVEMPNCDPDKLYQCTLQSNFGNSGTTAGDAVQVNVDIEATRDNGTTWVRVSRNRVDVQENSARTVIAKFPMANLPVALGLVKGETLRLRAQVQLQAGTSATTSFETAGDPGSAVFTLLECQP